MKKRNTRREKISEELIGTRIFDLFHEKSTYTLQELKNYLNQPKVYFFY